ncbi:methyltransferase domain-containing protein [Desulfopila sp. IMCC35008]|uniref:class I SAM-dependent methyltransferase n=1 Tax=Desulfopila sp. IMCC35008 TaxID=2653858 RepID=UPI0013D1B59E|nr:methyltransferase domain-containing protein [Desulfopila sp. IMCC35008]
MTHEFDGKKYEKASDHQKEWGQALIAELDLRGDEYVLDLGCGDGTLTKHIAELVPDGEVLGIDASLGMIDAALPKAAGNLFFQHLDINQLDFEDRFDIVYSNATLHWVKDHIHLLRSCRRALHDHGRLRFNFAGDGNCSSFFKVVREAMKMPAFESFFTGFDWPWYMPAVDDYQDLARSVSLTDVRVWGENADRYFPDEQAMIRWLDQPSLVPFLFYLGEREKGAFREVVINRMIEETKGVDGRCFETFRRINILAGK